MLKPLKPIGTAALLVGLLSWRGERVVDRVVSSCGPSNDENMRHFLDGARFLVSAPTQAKMRGILNVDAMDPALVKPIQSDSLCTLAARTINRDQKQPDTTSRTVYLVRMGRVYWAEDTTMHAGEWIRSVIMDSTLTRILSRPLN